MAGVEAKDYVIVDVGARWGVADRWASLAPGVRVFGFDPDAAECERLNQRARNAGDTTSTYVPLALGPTNSLVTLHNTVEPACSSIYPPIGRLTETFAELTCMTPVGQQSVSLTTLDQWCAEHGVDHVDMLKLDTQGSELGVLQGAEATLATVQLLEIEVEFNPLYEGQPLFGDIDAFLRARGFLLWRLDNLVHYSASGCGEAAMESVAYFDSAPVATQNRGGQLYWGHAHYVRAELCPAAVTPATPAHRARSATLAAAAGLTDLALYLKNGPMTIEQTRELVPPTPTAVRPGGVSPARCWSRWSRRT